MKLLSLLLLVSPAFAQADRIEMVSAKPGAAEAKVAGIVLRADHAIFNSETNQLQMSGHVHVLLPAREDHTVVRYGSRVIVTAQPIALTADRVAVMNGILEAADHILVVPAQDELSKMQLQGDQLSMVLKIGDATLRGDVKQTGVVRDRRGSGAAEFPPDIIK